MTNLKRESQRSPFDRVTTTRAKSTDRKMPLIYASVFTLALGPVLAANTWITIPEVEFGKGVANFPECIKFSVVDFDLDVSESGTIVSALDISELGNDCEDKYLRVSLLGSEDEIVGQFSSPQLESASSLRLTVDSQVINPASVFGVNFELSDRPF